MLIINYIRNDGFKFLNINEINNNIIILDKLSNIVKKYDYQIDCAYYLYNYKLFSNKNEIFSNYFVIEWI